MLKESVFLEHLKEFALKHSPNVIAYHNPNGNYVYVTEACENLWGYSVNEVIGENPYDYFHPEDISKIENDSHKPALMGKIIKGINFRFKRKDGRFRWMESVVIPVKEAKKVTGLISITKDIHKHKILEEKLEIERNTKEDLCRVAAIGYWSFNVLTGEIIWSNKTYDIHGLERGTKVDYEQAMSFYSAAGREKLEEAVRNTLEKGLEYDLRLPFTTAQKEKIWVRTIGQAFMRRGKCVKIFGVFQDVTEAVESENQKVSNMLEFLSIQNQQLKEFSQIISHDLRGPVTSLQMLSEELKSEETVDKELIENLDDVLNRLVTRLGFLNKIIDKPFEIKPIEKVNIKEVVDEIILHNNKIITDHNVKIEKGIFEWNFFRVERFKIKSILENLIRNAVYFSDPKKAVKKIKINTFLKEENHVLTIEDNGLGMNLKNSRDRRFGRINKFHPGLSGKGEGLFLVQTLVESMKGKLSVYSKEGKGTVAKINFDKYQLQEEIL